MTAGALEWTRDPYAVVTDVARIDVDVVHRYLSDESYWAAGIDKARVERAIANSIPFGLLHDGRTVGFARVVTDRATFAYLADVFVLEAHRGRGIAGWLMDCVMAHPDLQGLRRWNLLTRDAHALYRRSGFTALADPARWMERHDKDVYRTAQGRT